MTTETTKPFHIYAPDGFEGAFASLASATRAAKRGAKSRRLPYIVVQVDAYGLTGGGHGTTVAAVTP